jgi:NADH-quinone oxidoreductase subunit J
MTGTTVAFHLLAVASVVGAIALIFWARSTVGAAMGAVLASIAVAGLFALLSAPFLSITQLLLVVGAGGAGLLFVVLLVDLEAERLPARSVRRRIVNGLGVIAAASLAGVTVLTLESTPRPDLPVDANVGGVFALGETLYREFAAPLVGLSLVLLAGLVASRVLAGEGER